jgi:type II secretory pathway pseudopilin PulG
MLGVLAIMGVITVMGISGYSQAVARINRNKMVEDITRLAQEVRTVYAGRNSYATLTQADVYTIMGVANPYPNPFGGNYYIGRSNENTGFFCVSSTNISYQDCLYFYNMQWMDARSGNGTSSGGFPLVSDASLTPSSEVITAPNASNTCTTGGTTHSIVLCYQ